MTPAVAVVIAVRDGERWLADAIRSVYQQTFKDLVLVIADDGSTDGTPDVVARIATQQVPLTVFLRLTHGGLARALNTGIEAAAQLGTPFIARLDADDWMLPTRLERQVGLLQRYHRIGVLGSAVVERGPQGEAVRTYPVRHEDICRALARANPFAHSATCFRRDVFERAGGFDPTFPVAQDLDLWSRMLPLAHGFNLVDPLTGRRLHAGQISVQRAKLRRLMEARVRLRLLRRGELRAAWPCLRACLGAAVG